ncbi:DUF3054 domain-containing protein [Sinomonas halotolerans]|uniref:DUF3054 domain-containing protein n=1 Tax=Sinomonas halotolerans TaxID=1644133 RepID=A0ABU9X0W7_9MICC
MPDQPGSTAPPHPPAPSPSRHTARAAAVAACLDTAVVLAFAGLGRGFHSLENPVLGVLATAWPFLVGLAVAWAAFRVWRRPDAPWPTGIAVWIGSYALGMALRAAMGGATPVPFLLVAFGFLGALFLGWRAIALVAQRVLARDRSAGARAQR